MLPASTESAIANGDTRTIELYNQHTQESISATYRVNGQYDPAVLEKLNWFLRDWRRNEATKMDPRLFDAVWETYRTAGVTIPITVVCGYRSPQTNAMLRRRSRMVAEHSQHMLGKAMDTRMTGVSMERVREIAMRLQMGGVGFYGDSSFIHIDVGGVRYWPRMSYAQLARVFPDGKSVLLSTDNRKLPGYEEARADLAANGRAVAQVEPQQQSPNFFAWLFGGGKSSDGDADAEGAQPQQVAASAPVQQSQTAAAEAPPATKVETAQTTGAIEKTAVPETPAPQTLADAEANVPAPPHRPTDFLALADVPMPPNRPTLAEAAAAPLPPQRSAYLAPEATGSLVQVASSEPGVGLPTIITRGASESALAKRPPGATKSAPQVLAYAPVAQMEGLRSAAHGKPAKPGDAPATTAQLDHDSMMSPTLTGLRRAGAIETAALSQKLAAGYLARFAKVATNLPTDHFAGPAVVGLRSADRSRMMFIDSAVALKSQ